MRILGVDKDYTKNNDLPDWCNKECYALYIDQYDPLLVSDEIFFKNALYEREEISEQEYDRYSLEFKVECARNAAAGFMFYRRYTTAEVKKKLMDNGHEENAVDNAIEYYVTKGYLDDMAYAEAYVRTVIRNKIMSFNDMCMRLSAKGISREMTTAAAERNSFDDHAMAVKALEKKTHGNIPEDYKGKMKLMRYLAGKGFSAETIAEVVD